MFDTLKQWTCKIGRVEKLYAFTYQPPPPEQGLNGWNLYDARKEWNRQGVGREGSNANWRISAINTDYSVWLLNPFDLVSAVLRVVSTDNLVFSHLSGSTGCPVQHIR